MLKDAEITLLGAGYGRLSVKQKEKITGMAEALTFAQTDQTADSEREKTGGLQGGKPERQKGKG